MPRLLPVRAIPLAVVCGAALFPSMLRAEGVVRDSIGPVPGGRGGTNLAYDDNLALINDNPAALAGMEGIRVELDVDLLYKDINYRDPQNDEDAKSTVHVLPTVAASWQVTQDPLPIAVGLGLFLPAGFGAEYQLEHPVYGSQKYKSQAALYKLMPVVSADIGWGISIGAGIGPAFESAEFQAPFTFQTGALAGTPALVDTEMDGFGYAWNVGLQFRPTDRLTLGIAYISETSMDLEGDFHVDATGVLPVPDATATYDGKLLNKWPRSLGVGGSYRFDWGTVSLDFLWFDWSSAFDSLEFKLYNGSNPVINGIVGPNVTDTFPLDWKDSYTVRVGGELFLTPDDTLRLGYIYISNSIPDRTLTPLIPAILEHAITIGYGHLFGTLQVDLAYQFSFGPRRSVDTSAVVGGDYDQSSIQVMAHWFVLGAQYRF